MKEDFQILSGLIGFTEEDLDLFLYHLSEKFEDRYSIYGIWTSGIFRNFWKDVANRCTREFLERIHIKEDGSFCYQLYSEYKGWQFIYKHEEIRKLYKRFLTRKILGQPINTSVMELINIKTVRQ